MASATCQLSGVQFLCSICLDVFTEPVTIPCGHNFCRGCINQHISTNTDWFCPICKESFNFKPVLRVNRFISEMATLFRQSQDKDDDSLEFEALTAPISEEVPCEQCTEPKQNAVKSCLVCLASYCEFHLEPHFDMIGLRRHQLIEPQRNLEDRVCKQHDKPLELFCLDDKVCVCVLCMCSNHKGHNVVPLKDAFEEHQQKLKELLLLKELKTEVQEDIKQSKEYILSYVFSMQEGSAAAERELAHGVDIFTSLKETVESALNDLTAEINSKRTDAEDKANILIDALFQDYDLMKEKGSAVKRVLRTDDHFHLLRNFSDLQAPSRFGGVGILYSEPIYQGTVARALAKLEMNLTKKTKEVFEAELNIAKTVQKDVTFDAETAHPDIHVSRNGKEITPNRNKKHVPPKSSKRFDDDCFVMGSQGFYCCFYFEIAVSGKSEWTVGVATESINRKGLIKKDSENSFWAIKLENKSYFASPYQRIATK